MISQRVFGNRYAEDQGGTLSEINWIIVIAAITSECLLMCHTLC